MPVARPRLGAAVAVLLAACACNAPAVRFSETNARAHVSILASTIGSRPVGTDANRRAREYLVGQLQLYGFDVRVQVAEAVRRDRGLTARVANIVATRPGSRPDALALVAHYDSVPESPGAADDGLGVAVCLEAARVLAARPVHTNTLVVALTDGEEVGMMGAEALLADPVMRQVRAYLNFEAIGSSGPSLLFETGPGNAWLVRAWARHAPQPAGASYATEIYKRLPNDTDFSVLRRSGAPGLNFAPIGDSYTYHSPRDAIDRLSGATLRQTGENAVAVVEALDQADLTQESAAQAIYFDIGRRTAVVFGPTAGRAIAWSAVLAGLLCSLRLFSAARRRAGVAGCVVTGLWAIVVAAATVGSMVAATWLLREVREVYHPWYAHPGPFFLLLLASGLSGAWLVTRIRLILPARARGSGHPVVLWTVVLPAWTTLAAAAAWWLPAASYLTSVPLLAAALLLAGVPLGPRPDTGGKARPDRARAVRLASVIVFGTAGILWIRPAVDLLAFSVPALGRFQLVTPIVAYPALLAALTSFLAPPAVAALAGWRPLARRLGFRAGVLALVGLFAAAYLVPAYTDDRPLRHEIRYVNDLAGGRAYWEMGSNEPGMHLAGPAAGTTSWQPGAGPLPLTLDIPRLGWPFCFRARTATIAPIPADVRGRITEEGGEAATEIALFPREPGLTVAFVMPPGTIPVEANLAGRLRGGRWWAMYVAPPAEGVVFRARFHDIDAVRLRETGVMVMAAGLPAGEGWQRLPAWLPQARSVWSARSYYLVPAFGTPGPD